MAVWQPKLREKCKHSSKTTHGGGGQYTAMRQHKPPPPPRWRPDVIFHRPRAAPSGWAPPARLPHGGGCGGGGRGGGRRRRLSGAGRERRHRLLGARSLERGHQRVPAGGAGQPRPPRLRAAVRGEKQKGKKKGKKGKKRGGGSAWRPHA